MVQGRYIILHARIIGKTRFVERNSDNIRFAAILLDTDVTVHNIPLIFIFSIPFFILLF